MSTHTCPTAHPASNSGISNSRRGTFTSTDTGISIFTGKPNNEKGDYSGCSPESRSPTTDNESEKEVNGEITKEKGDVLVIGLNGDTMRLPPTESKHVATQTDNVNGSVQSPRTKSTVTEAPIEQTGKGENGSSSSPSTEVAVSRIGKGVNGGHEVESGD